jgi:hypothetical protein
MSFHCRACQISNPLNAITNAITCYHCGETNTLDTAFWTWFLHPEIFDRAARLADGEEGRSGRVMPVCMVHFARSAPHCPDCKYQLPPESLEEHSSGGRCFCPTCGRAIPLRAADALCKSLNAGARVVVGESLPSVIEAAKTPIVFACMSCGAGLKVDGTSRTCACTYCHASNYLPEGLWRQLHPVPKPHDFYLVYR